MNVFIQIHQTHINKCWRNCHHIHSTLPIHLHYLYIYLFRRETCNLVFFFARSSLLVTLYFFIIAIARKILHGQHRTLCVSNYCFLLFIYFLIWLLVSIFFMFFLYFWCFLVCFFCILLTLFFRFWKCEIYMFLLMCLSDCLYYTRNMFISYTMWQITCIW